MPGRRQVLKQLAGGIAAQALVGMAARQVFASEPAREAGAPTLSQVTPNVTLLSGLGGNVVALSTPEGLAVIDSGAPEHSGELLKALAALPGGKNIRTVFNTHWHWEHTGGNEALRKAGAQIIAHENTRLWLGTEVTEEWENRTYKPRPPQALPTSTFYTKTNQLTFGTEPIEYGWLGQAHTDGDIYVYLRGQNVLIVGGVLTVGRYPVLDYCTGGWIMGMRDATQKLLDLSNEQTKIIPGSGPVQTRADLKAEHDMLAAMHDKVWAMMRKGMTASEILAAKASADFDAKWGDPKQFITSAYQGIYGHIADFLGKGVV
jgi:glyoxylase-like metal-dependent hydrolase (beta-lactamase superfamily II)